MSLRTKPTRVSGKNPAYMSGDYPEMRQKKTQQDLINEGKKFKFSVLKKPYMSDLSYQEMEYEATPLAQSPFSPNAMFPKFKGLDGVPLISGGDIAKYPCTCGGCTGAGAMGDTSDLWKELERLIAEGIIKTQADIKAWIVSHWEQQLGGYTLAGVPSEYQCGSTEIETFYITICGRRNETVHLESSARDSLFALSSFEVPFPDESKCTTIDRCACHTIGVNVNCGAGFENCVEERDVFISACKRTQAIKIKRPSSACSSLTIVDEDGSPATDTILRIGSLDFKATGGCCGEIQWTVSPETGGTTISAAGVLTAGATSCGSLLVTATCPACGTNNTHSVRVTNGGQWVQTGEFVNNCPNCDCPQVARCSCITGNARTDYYTSSTQCYGCLPPYCNVCPPFVSYCSDCDPWIGRINAACEFSCDGGCYSMWGYLTYEWRCV